MTAGSVHLQKVVVAGEYQSCWGADGGGYDRS